MPQELPNLELVIKLLKMTTSSHDGEALVALRKANEQITRYGWDWDSLLRSKVKIVGDPFGSMSAPPTPKATPRPQPSPAPKPTFSCAECNTRGHWRVISLPNNTINRFCGQNCVDAYVIKNLTCAHCSHRGNVIAFFCSHDKRNRNFCGKQCFNAYMDKMLGPKVAPPSAMKPQSKPNVYAGSCSVCRIHIAVGQGKVFRPNAGSNWRLYCNACARRATHPKTSTFSADDLD